MMQIEPDSPATLRLLTSNITRCTVDLTKRLNNVVATAPLDLTPTKTSEAACKIQNFYLRNATTHFIQSLHDSLSSVTNYYQQSERKSLKTPVESFRDASRALLSFTHTVQSVPIFFPPFFFRHPDTRILLDVQTSLPMLPNYLVKTSVVGSEQRKSYIARPDTHVVLNISIHIDHKDTTRSSIDEAEDASPSHSHAQKKSRAFKFILATIRGYDLNGTEVTAKPLFIKMKCKVT